MSQNNLIYIAFLPDGNKYTCVHIMQCVPQSHFDISRRSCHYYRSWTIPAGYMAELRIRKLDDWVTSWFKSQAKLHNHSLERELRELLTEIVRSRKQQIAGQMLADLESLEQKHGLFPDSSKGIREERDKRG
jgi:plasmid stability protein